MAGARRLLWLHRELQHRRWERAVAADGRDLPGRRALKILSFPSCSRLRVFSLLFFFFVLFSLPFSFFPHSYLALCSQLSQEMRVLSLYPADRRLDIFREKACEKWSKLSYHTCCCLLAGSIW